LPAGNRSSGRNRHASRFPFFESGIQVNARIGPPPNAIPITDQRKAGFDFDRSLMRRGRKPKPSPQDHETISE